MIRRKLRRINVWNEPEPERVFTVDEEDDPRTQGGSMSNFTVKKIAADIMKSLTPIAPPLTFGGACIYRFTRGGRKFLLSHENGAQWVIRFANPDAMIPVASAPTLRACVDRFARGYLATENAS